MMRGRLGAALALAALAVGCSSDLPRTEQGGGSGKVIIRILSATDSSLDAGNRPIGGATGIYAQLVNWWNHNKLESTGIELRLDTVSGGATTVHSQMVSEAQGPDQDPTDRVDIYNLDSQWMREFIRGGYLHPLQDLVDQKKINMDDFLPKPWASAQDNQGRLLAVPFTTDAGLLYYRTDAQPPVEPALTGGPHTFGELVDHAEKITNFKPGYIGQFENYEGLTVNALEAIWSYSPATFTSRSSAGKGEIRTALTALVKAYRLLPTHAATTAGGGYDEAKAAADFAEGRAAMMRNWPIHYARILAGGPGIIDKNKFKVAPLPYPSVLGGQNLAISRNTDNLNAAIKVVQFLTDKDTQRCLFAVGGFPATRHDAYDEAWPGPQALPGASDGTADLRCGTSKGSWTTIGPTIRQAVAGAQPRPPIPQYTQFSDLLATGVHGLFSDQSPTPPDETITSLVSDLSTAFDKP